MLLEFSVTNFRSIREKRTLCSPIGQNIEAIYGRNGSGKTNLLKAFRTFQHIVSKSHTLQPGEYITTVSPDLEPYLLSEETKEAPTEFKITFDIKGDFYIYAIALNQKEILYEELTVTISTSPFKKLLLRRHQGETYFSKQVKGQRSLWKKSTGSNQLFLSKAINMQCKEFLPVYNFISNGFRVLTDMNFNGAQETCDFICKSTENKNKVLNLYESLDLPVIDIDIVELSGGISKAFMVYENDQGLPVRIPLFSESQGAKVIFNLSHHIIEIIDKGGILLVDDLCGVLHPKTLEGLLSIFKNSDNAQIAFTTRVF